MFVYRLFFFLQEIIIDFVEGVLQMITIDYVTVGPIIDNENVWIICIFLRTINNVLARSILSVYRWLRKFIKTGYSAHV